MVGTLTLSSFPCLDDFCIIVVGHEVVIHTDHPNNEVMHRSRSRHPTSGRILYIYNLIMFPHLIIWVSAAAPRAFVTS